MTFNHILVATDLSPRGHLALLRACHLAIEHGAGLHVMHLERRRVRDAALARRQLDALAARLPASPRLRTSVLPPQQRAVPDLLAAARGMDLVVLAPAARAGPRDWLQAHLACRVAGHAACPVLVVGRTTVARYATVLVGVGLSPTSAPLVQLAAALDPHAQLQVFHAIGTANEARLRSAEASEQAVRAYREQCLAHARDHMASLAESLDVRRNRVHSVVGRGDPARQLAVQQEHSGADLVVVGKPAQAAWRDALCGSVAGRVLAWSEGDVLVVPQPLATRGAASQRLQSDLRARLPGATAGAQVQP